MRSKIVYAVLALALVGSSAFATDGTKMVGFNAKAAGRGGTALGIFDTPTLMMTNPAGISFLPQSSIDVNFSLMVPSLHFKNGLNDADGQTNYFPLPGAAYVQNNGGSFSWGVGAFTQGGMGADFTLNHNLFRSATGQFVPQEYHSKFAVMQGGPSAAYKLSPDLSVGVSAHVVYGQLEFSMPYSLSPSIMKGVVNPMTGMTFGDMFSAPTAQGGFGYSEVTAAAKMTDLTALGFQGKIGVAYKVNGALSLGVSYSSPVTLTFKNGKAMMDMTAQLNDAFGRAMQGYMAQNPSATQLQAQAAVMQQFSQLGIDMTKGVVAHYDLENTLKLPQTIGIGGAYQASEQLRIAVDIEWLNWESAFDKMALSMSNGDNANINRMLGNTGSFGIDFPMNWKNSVSFRLGAEYMLNKDITTRVGFVHGSNPVPEQTLFPVFPAIVEDHLTLGGSLAVTNAIDVDLAYELALNNSQVASASSRIASEYNGSTSQLSENIFHLSLSIKL